MPRSHEADPCAIPSIEELRSFVRECRSRAPTDFERFEAELHDRVTALERELLADELVRHDLDAERVEVDGQVYRRSLRCEETYTSAAGPIRVERWLYAPSEGGPTECPLELGAGIIEGRFTPRAAELVLFTMAQLTPGECEKLFGKLGGMQPSRSSLDRLPRKVSDRWEANRRAWERAVRRRERVPSGAEHVVLSLDGVHVPMRETPRKEGDTQRAYREAACATVSVYDSDGERLQTRRWARMPQSGKPDLTQQLSDEYEALGGRSRIRGVKLSDGAESNWRILDEIHPGGWEVLDFYHACEHLGRALKALHGEETVRCKAEFAALRTILRDAEDGTDEMIRTLRNAIRRGVSQSVRRAVRAEIRYFEGQRHRMDYATYQAMGFPIGSGVTEAACKTLVSARLKRSGMSWRHPGGQAVLTLRSLQQSDRWDAGWDVIAQSYRKEVDVVEPMEKAA